MSLAGKSIPCAKPLTVMAFRDSWHRTLVYFGPAVEDDYAGRRRGRAVLRLIEIEGKFLALVLGELERLGLDT